MFITFEGPEGSGKTTQAELLSKYLEKKGHSVLITREPGGTFIGEQIRNILLSKDNYMMKDEVELFLYLAARAQLVHEVINPALNRGNIVICDRFSDSTIAYQGYGRGINIVKIKEINKIATGDVVPDITMLLDIDPVLGLRRNRTEDRIQNEEVAFHCKVREGYLSLQKEEQNRIILIDATKDIDTVHGEVVKIIEDKLKTFDQTLD